MPVLEFLGVALLEGGGEALAAEALATTAVGETLGTTALADAAIGSAAGAGAMGDVLSMVGGDALASGFGDAALGLGGDTAALGLGQVGAAGFENAALTPAAMESLMGSTGYGTNASAFDAALNAGLNTNIVGSDAVGLGGSGSLFNAPASALASGYSPSMSALTNEAVASGMSPGSLGAQMAANGTLTPAELAAAQGVVTEGSALSNLPSIKNPFSSDKKQQAGSKTTNVFNTPAIPNATPSAGGLAHTGAGPVATSYSERLPQLNLAPEHMVKISDIQNTPSLSQLTGYAPQQGYAMGGGVRHYATAGGVSDDSSADSSADKQAALLQYYKDSADKKQKDSLNESFKNLANLDVGFKPPAAQMIRTGQMGSNAPARVVPQLAALLRQRGMTLASGGQPDHAHPNYDGVPVFRTGGLEGLGGKYVEGKGDGTSDDITAMLANGEYVFSADVVSALGNGSNKAGAKALDQTVEAIRKRARSAPPDKLPPDAKSPLEYMASVKGKKHG